MTGVKVKSEIGAILKHLGPQEIALLRWIADGYGGVGHPEHIRGEYTYWNAVVCSRFKLIHYPEDDEDWMQPMLTPLGEQIEQVLRGD